MGGNSRWSKRWQLVRNFISDLSRSSTSAKAMDELTLPEYPQAVQALAGGWERRRFEYSRRKLALIPLEKRAFGGWVGGEENLVAVPGALPTSHEEPMACSSRQSQAAARNRSSLPIDVAQAVASVSEE